MWKTMVAPLFDPALMLSNTEPSATAKESLNRLIAGTFKRYLLIPKTTSSELVWDMMGENWGELANRMNENFAQKWFARREYREPTGLIQKQKESNYLRGIPNTWCTILRQQCRLCPECRGATTSTTNEYHMREVHQIKLMISYKDIWQQIKDYHDEAVRQHEKRRQKEKTIQKIKRGVFLEYWKPLLEEVRVDTDQKLLEYHMRKEDERKLDKDEEEERESA